jgi:hypothetical protein
MCCSVFVLFWTYNSLVWWHRSLNVNAILWIMMCIVYLIKFPVVIFLVISMLETCCVILCVLFWTSNSCGGDLFWLSVCWKHAFFGYYLNVGNMCRLFLWHRSLNVSLVRISWSAWFWNWWKFSVVLAWFWNWWKWNCFVQLWSVGWANYLNFGRNLTVSLVCFVGHT